MAAVILVDRIVPVVLINPRITSIQGIVVTWKEIPYLLANFRVSAGSMCTLGIGAVRMVGCRAKCFV